MNDDSEYRGLRETPIWRWGVYTTLFIGVIVWLSHTLNDRTIFWGGMAGGVVVTTAFCGMNALLTNPKGRVLIARNLGILISIYVLGTIVLFIWDMLTKK
jgi:hypothetical protein